MASPGRIRVVLADDSLLVREGVRALLATAGDIEVVGQAADRDALLATVDATVPQVVVTDVRMPPSFRSEGIDAALDLRKRHPGTGVVVLSQYDDPEYALALLADGAEGCAYLLKDRLSEGDELLRAVRTVSTGGTLLDPQVVEALVAPVRDAAALSRREERLLQLVAEGRSVARIAAAMATTPADAAASVERLLLRVARDASAGRTSALARLTALHRAIVDREERGETMSRFLPGGIADALLREGHHRGEPRPLDVSVLMADVRGYTTIAEHADPATLAGQLHEHRAAMTRCVLDAGGTVMQFAGDATYAVFGAPLPAPDHAPRAVAAALAMQAAQAEVNARWTARALPPFPLGIGISSGAVAAAVLGSEERLEYTLVGDVVNLAQRLQQMAADGETVVAEATRARLAGDVDAEPLPPRRVRGRSGVVVAFRLAAV